jgi:hypothetical protein
MAKREQCRAKDKENCTYHHPEKKVNIKRTTKYCPKCKETLDKTAFNKETAAPDGLMSWCRSCLKSHLKAHREKNKAENNTSYTSRFDVRRRAMVNEIITPLRQRPCMDCKKTYSIDVMEFDHARGEKIANISEIHHAGTSDIEMMKTLKEELLKCDVCCANCHKERTISRYANSGRRDYAEGKLDSRFLNKRSLYIYETQAKQGCVDCGEKNILVLESDHVRGMKIDELARMVKLSKYSIEQVQEELDKCETRCTNCHRQVTLDRRRKIAKPTLQIFNPVKNITKCACGNKKNYKAFECIACSRMLKPENYPTAAEIIEGVESLGWLQFAKSHNLSDNGMRKVAIRLGIDPLPKKKSKKS